MNTAAVAGIPTIVNRSRPSRGPPRQQSPQWGNPQGLPPFDLAIITSSISIANHTRSIHFGFDLPAREPL